MSTPNNHSKKYSLADIEQYLQGKLSPAEMHEMEKAAVQDPFLADAMEGYRATDIKKANQDLEAIRIQLLQEETEIAPVVKLRATGKYKFYAAAVIVLLAGVSTLAWFLWKPDQLKKEMVQSSIEQNKKDTLLKKDSTALLPSTLSKQKTDLLAAAPSAKNRELETTSVDSTLYKKEKEAIAETALAANELSVKRMDSLSDKMVMAKSMALNSSSNPVTVNVGAINANQYRAGFLSVSPQLSITAVGAFNATSVTGLLAAGSISGTTINLPNNIYSGKVVDVNNKPISWATVTAANQITQTDSAGRFTIQTKDSIQKVKINAIAFEEATAQLKLSEPIQITLKDNSGSLNEVVVVGYQAAKKKDLTGSVSTKKETATSGLQSTIHPAVRWDSLVTYLRTKMSITSSDKPAKGDIKVKLTIKKGKIVEVEILETFNESLNKKLISALKKGPAWISNDKSANKQTHITSIHFQ